MSASPDRLDALIAAPETHSLLFENDDVRVIATRIAPGETTALHTHCWPQLMVVLNCCRRRRCSPPQRCSSRAKRRKPP